MKVLVIGGVAAGTKAAAKIKRQNRGAEVKILTQSADISYAGCGLPYYVGGMIESREELIVNTPEKYTGLTGVEVVTRCEVTSVDFQAKTVTALCQGQTWMESYDKLVIATGATPFVPQVEGIRLPGVFTMRTPDDAIALRAYVQDRHCRSAVVVGAGFIGLEIAENLQAQGLAVTVIDAADQILPKIFDPEMAGYARRRLRQNGIRVLTGTPLNEITGTERADGVLANGSRISADLVVLAIGIRPATSFLNGSGLAMEKGAIVVDEMMRTNISDVYAAGDCALVRNQQTHQPQWSAMGSTANITARALACTMTGTEMPYGGCLGTGVVRLGEGFNAGRTGLTEAQAREAGYEPVTVVCASDDKAHYYPGSSFFMTKLIADRSTHQLLGIQVLGSAVDKMVDIAVTGIAAGMTLEAFNSLDYSYAPPFSTAIHPFVQACLVLENKLSGAMTSMTPADYANGAAKDYQVVDVLPKPTIAGAKWVDLAQVNGPIEGLERDAKLLLVCNRGRRAYLLQNRLRHFGYTQTVVLEGGVAMNEVKVQFAGAAIPPDEIKRVKGLGCLQDKRYPDRFNVRVITRNGKITSEEQRKIAEAAELFGTGEVTMTTRLTLEVQGVPYANLDALMTFLNDAGLETGGTGSKVRPVVSCKGTTCQYGLIDTFQLSQKLHDLFYIGYHDVVLPHKFKLAVGGCPNNCVKPNLNDLGIVGQRIPEIDLAKCRGCKVCQIEKTCPIGAAKLIDGKLQIDADLCNHCGRCVSKCPFKAIEESTYGYKVYIGGRWGKKVAEGKPLSRIFTSEEEVLAVVERTILFYRDEGITGERFADTIARLGFDYVEDKLLNGSIDKDSILKKTVVGGAKC